jgi:uncharacterized protein YpbB
MTMILASSNPLFLVQALSVVDELAVTKKQIAFQIFKVIKWRTQF